MVDLPSDPSTTLLSVLRQQIDDELDEMGEWTFVMTTGEIPISRKQESKKFVASVCHASQVTIRNAVKPNVANRNSGTTSEVAPAAPNGPMAPPLVVSSMAVERENERAIERMRH